MVKFNTVTETYCDLYTTRKSSMACFQYTLSVVSFITEVTGLSYVCHGQYTHASTRDTVWRCAHSSTLQNSQPKQKGTTCIISSVTHTVKSGFLFIWTLNNWLDPRCNNCLPRKKKQQFPLSISRAGNNRRQLKWVNRVTEPLTFCLACEFLKFSVAFKQMQSLF